MIRTSLELKIIVYVLLFGLFLTGFQRYYLSGTTEKEFARSKESKNELLADIIMPVVTINMAMGLDEANREYLDEIASKNSDIKHMEILDEDNRTLYTFSRYPSTIDPAKRNRLNFCKRQITDPYTHDPIGRMSIYFFEHDLQKMRQSYRDIALFTLAVSLLTIIFFIFLLKQEFKRLKQLSASVLSYDPAKREFSVAPSKNTDEVGIIQNAIIKMVDKLNSYARELDETNRSLEEKVLSRTRELEAANEQLEKLTMTDMLTGLPNRRHFEQQYAQIWELSKRNNLRLSVVMCDIDLFKKINDTYGHLVGDIVLKKIAEILKNTSKRSTDYIARIGGEEFILILPDADEVHATAFCEMIQQHMQRLSIVIDETTVLENITFSFGVSTLVPKEDMWLKIALKQADDALYKAKENGRNTVVVYQKPDNEVT
jgi:diguanylate cyclase (GGDEF)-like protein